MLADKKARYGGVKASYREANFEKTPENEPMTNVANKQIYLKNIKKV
jgi:hypothetical protein